MSLLEKVLTSIFVREIQVFYERGETFERKVVKITNKAKDTSIQLTVSIFKTYNWYRKNH